MVESFARSGWNLPSPKATMFVWSPIPDQYAHLGSLEFAKLLIQETGVAVAPGVGFGEYGDQYVRLALVENEQRIRQAARNIKKFLAGAAEPRQRRAAAGRQVGGEWEFNSPIDA